MKVNYENKMKDILSFSLSHYFRSPINLIVMLFILVVFALPNILSSTMSVQSKVFSIIFLAVLLVVVMTLFLIIYVIFSYSSKKNKNVLTSHTIELFDEYFIESTSLNKNEYKWESVVKLRNTRNYLFIYVNRNTAHIIPKSSFNSIDELSLYWNYLVSKVSI